LPQAGGGMQACKAQSRQDRGPIQKRTKKL